jgi:hypothetical protein
MQISMDDLERINAAVIKAGRSSAEPPPPDAIALNHVATALEQAEGFSMEDPVRLAAHLAAYVSWARPFGSASDRTALLTAAVVLDLTKAKMPRDWAGGAALLVEFRTLGVGPGARSAALKDWLAGGTPPSDPGKRP